jgi:multidrug efflux pump subunit AcrB
VPFAYFQYGKGVEFFPNVEPEYGLLYVHARGNLSLAEQDAVVRQAENRILGWPGIETVYTRVGQVQGGGAELDEDVVGVIQYEFVDWRERKPARYGFRRSIRPASTRRRGKPPRYSAACRTSSTYRTDCRRPASTGNWTSVGPGPRNTASDRDRWAPSSSW